MHNISRYDDRYETANFTPTYGYMVRIQRTVDGRTELHCKFFSDKGCNGKENAKSAAIAWRDKTLASLPPPAYHLPSGFDGELWSKNIKTGVPGLFLVWRDRHKNGCPTPALIVNKRIKGHKINATIGITKRTITEALVLACRRLAEGERIAMGIPDGKEAVSFEADRRDYYFSESVATVILNFEHHSQMAHKETL